MVDRGSAPAAELTRDELRAGGVALAGKVNRYAPRWLAVLGVTAYRDAFDEPKAAIGRQERTIGAASVWVLPNPSGLNAHFTLDALATEFAKLRQATVRTPAS